MLANKIEHYLRIAYWNGIFKFQPRDSVGRALDGQVGLLARNSDAYRTLLDVAEISLPVKHSIFSWIPEINAHKIFVFNFSRHRNVPRKT